MLSNSKLPSIYIFGVSNLFYFVLAITKKVCEKDTLQIDCDWGERIEMTHVAYGIYSSKNPCGISYRKNCVDELQSLKVMFVISDSIKFRGPVLVFNVNFITLKSYTKIISASKLRLISMV